MYHTHTTNAPHIYKGSAAAPARRVRDERGNGGRQPSERLLVSTPISQRTPPDQIQFSYRSLRVKRYSGQSSSVPPDRTGSEIQGFSSKSRSRLRLYATNNSHRIRSQFCLTYPADYPTEGRTVKRHLNAWLQFIRRHYSWGYLWILEFQSRGAAHFHVFLTAIPHPDDHRRIAEAWNRITGSGPDHLAFHLHPRNWVLWDVSTGGYLVKYLDKDAQKMIPENCSNFGRFWGNSKCMKPEFIGFPVDDLDHLSVTDTTTGEVYGGKETVLRWLGRLAKKQTRGYSRFKERCAHTSYTILDGVRAYNQIERYFYRLQSTTPPKFGQPNR